MNARFASVDEMLSDARSRLARLHPRQALDAIGAGARLVDIRPSWQRRQEGEIPGALIIERNHLEWRLHPGSNARVPAAVEGQRWIIFCSEGYTSSLAADSLTSLGIGATDVVGGYAAWRAEGLPTGSGETPLEQVVPG
jgi:rhodanese-related sulfurtransferase